MMEILICLKGWGFELLFFYLKSLNICINQKLERYIVRTLKKKSTIESE